MSGSEGAQILWTGKTAAWPLKREMNSDLLLDQPMHMKKNK